MKRLIITLSCLIFLFLLIVFSEHRNISRHGVMIEVDTKDQSLNYFIHRALSQNIRKLPDVHIVGADENVASILYVSADSLKNQTDRCAGMSISYLFLVPRECAGREAEAAKIFGETPEVIHSDGRFNELRQLFPQLYILSEQRLRAESKSDLQKMCRRIIVSFDNHVLVPWRRFERLK